jgi:hypothetical protein
MVLFAWTVGFTGATVWLAFALALGLAHLSHRFIEQPLRHASWGSTPWRECLAGLCLAGVAGMAVAVIYKVPDDALYLGRPAVLEAVGAASLSQPYTSHSGAVWGGSPCLLMSNDEVGKAFTPEACVVGAPLENADRRVLVIGNSFSAAFVQAFDELAELSAMSTIVTSSWGASIAPGVLNDGTWDKANTYYWAEVVPALIADLLPRDRVIIMSDVANISASLAATNTEAQIAAQRLDAAKNGLRDFAETLAAREIGLSVLGPLPFARDANCTPAQGQSQWFSPAGQSCTFLTRAETRTRMTQTRQMLNGLEAEGILRVLDLFNYFCESSVCDYVDAKGQLLYRDVWSHPSVEAARAVRPLLAQHLLQP